MSLHCCCHPCNQLSLGIYNSALYCPIANVTLVQTETSSQFWFASIRETSDYSVSQCTIDIEPDVKNRLIFQTLPDYI